MIWAPLLLSLWCLRLAVSQGDPIPEEVYSALSGTAIRSFGDLRNLLRIDSVEEEEGSWWHRTKNNSTMSRARRSIDVMPAVMAECKPRTEVFDIPRGLVDPTNANFLVWPSCVEVERCSGCCHNRQCVAARVQLRHVQVNKIEITPRKKPVLHKVLVTLEDHLECRCQAEEAVLRHAHPLGTPEPTAVPPGKPTAPSTPRPWTTAPAPIDSRERTRHRPAKRKYRKYKHLQGQKTLKEFYAP